MLRSTLALLSLAGASSSAQAQSAWVLHDLGPNPSPFTSWASDVSDDGRSIVVTDNLNGFRWTALGGMTPLAPAALGFRPSRMTSDGSVVVGLATIVPGQRVGARFDASGVTLLSGLVGNVQSVTDVSTDGSVIVGTDVTGAGVRPMRWRSTQGTFVAIGSTSSYPFGSARAVSEDGRVVVGNAKTTLIAPNFIAAVWSPAVWTPSVNPLILGTLPGGSTSDAVDTSADGSVVVGSSGTANGRFRAFRWTQALGMVDLGVLPGADFSLAQAVSDDGLTVVGWSGILVSGVYEAFAWTPWTGMVALPSHPTRPDCRAFGVNGNGSVIVGWARDLGNNEALPVMWTAAGSSPFTPYGTGAASGQSAPVLSGLVATGTGTVGDTVRFGVSGLDPRQSFPFGALAFSLSPASTPPYLIDPINLPLVLILPVGAGPDAYAERLWNVPAAAAGLSVFVQYFGIDESTGAVVSSNGLRFDVP